MRFRSLMIGVLALSCAAHVMAKSGPLPHLTFYKMRTSDGIVSLVVSANTTDQQLESLLSFIRGKVQHRKFVDLGIRRPTDERFGKLGYGAGVILIYRGPRCANEEFIEDLGPCGYGEHDAASYQWGIDGDSKNDSGAIRTKDGDLQTVF